MKVLKINFVDFWSTFNKTDNYFYHTLKSKYNIEIEENDPDFIFYSCFGSDHKNYNCKKIVFLGENINHNKFNHDLAFSFDKTENKNVYLPLWVLYLNWFNLKYDENRDPAYLLDIDKLLNPKLRISDKSKFCCFIVGNPKNQLRNQVAQYISNYKTVDCPGLVLNNCERLEGRNDQIQKIKYLEQYKFNICFENSSGWGYVTEKIIHPLYTGTIPIYWGGINVDQFFNEKAFINCNTMNNYDEILSKVTEVDNNKDLYVSILEEKIIKDETILDQFNPLKILEKIDEHIIS